MSDLREEIFQYEGSPITFQQGDSVMVNATEMAKPFGKNVSHWLRNQSTKEFLSELSALRNRKGSELVSVENGVGAWMHEDVALEFARWLSPAFAIWCNDRIKELLTQGVATVSNDLNAQQLNFNPVEKGHNFDNHQNAETNSLDNSTMIIGNHVNQLSTQLLLELVGIIKQLLPANLQSKAST